jgi:hypothetical protein
LIIDIVSLCAVRFAEPLILPVSRSSSAQERKPS